MTEPTIAGWNESIRITRGECEAGLAAVEMQREFFTKMVDLIEEYRVEIGQGDGEIFIQVGAATTVSNQFEFESGSNITFREQMMNEVNSHLWSAEYCMERFVKEHGK
jgi:hypothetical protein